MSHFGVLSYKGAGHLNPLIALSHELVNRGHVVTFFLPPDKEDRVRRHRLGFVPIEMSEPGDRTASPASRPLTAAEWIGDTRAKLHRVKSEMGTFLREYPTAVRNAGVDALIMGEISFTGPTVAELLGLPYFVISTSIPHNFGWDAPRSIRPRRHWLEKFQQELLQVSIFRMKGPVGVSMNRYRRKLGLDSVRRMTKTFPELAHITQWPQCLDYSRDVLPQNLHYAGPFVDETTREHVEFPWNELDHRPVVYVSLGTTKRADISLFSNIAAACVGLDLQVVITLGNRRDSVTLGALPGNPIVVRNAPQLELLKMATVVITHAGPNTVLETLLQGKPMLALPVTLDQPAVAARVARLGAAEFLAPHQCSSEKIRLALVKLLTDSSYRRAATTIQEQLKSLQGTSHAAGIIEERLANWSRARSPSQCTIAAG
jgi:MGT family glycosyltransferase